MDELERVLISIADSVLENTASSVRQELKAYALAHKRTGLLYKNIKMTKTTKKGEIVYVVDGGTRANYGGKSYHPITFFKTDIGRQSLSETLRRARNKIK